MSAAPTSALEVSSAAAVLLAAAVLTVWAIKRAMIGDRPALQSIVCWLDGGRHSPVRHPLGGFRCRYCQAAAGDLGEWGYPGWVGPLRTLYSRHDGAIERSEWPEDPRP